MIKLYLLNPGYSTINEMRLKVYQRKLGDNKLPPTSGAVAQHLLKAYHQVQQWMGVDLDPIKYGWSLEAYRRAARTNNSYFTSFSSIMLVKTQQVYK